MLYVTLLFNDGQVQESTWHTSQAALAYINTCLNGYITLSSVTVETDAPMLAIDNARRIYG